MNTENVINNISWDTIQQIPAWISNLPVSPDIARILLIVIVLIIWYVIFKIIGSIIKAWIIFLIWLAVVYFALLFAGDVNLADLYLKTTIQTAKDIKDKWENFIKEKIQTNWKTVKEVIDYATHTWADIVKKNVNNVKRNVNEKANIIQKSVEKANTTENNIKKHINNLKEETATEELSNEIINELLK